MKLLASLLLAFCSLAGAADYLCEPERLIPSAVATTEVAGTTPAGEWHAWWCLDPVATAAAGAPRWQSQMFRVLNKYKTGDAFAIAQRLWASNSVADLIDAVNKGAITPLVGSQDEYDYKTLGYLACHALVTPPLLPPVANIISASCLMPPAPTGVFRVTKIGTIFTTTGTKLTGVTGRSSVVNTLCDCTQVNLSGYCPLASAPVNEVTACQQVGP